MFNVSLFGFDPVTYEAIIAAFIVIGLAQSAALRRKAKQVKQLRKSATDTVLAAVDTIAKIISASSRQNLRLIVERDAARREAMEAQADLDDATDEIGRLATQSVERAFSHDVSPPDFDVFGSLDVSAALFRVNSDGSLTAVPWDGSTCNRDLGAKPFNIDELLATLNTLDPYKNIADDITRNRGKTPDADPENLKAAAADTQPAYYSDEPARFHSGGIAGEYVSPRAG